MAKKTIELQSSEVSAKLAVENTILSIIRKNATYFENNVWPQDIKDYADYVVYTSKYDKE